MLGGKYQRNKSSSGSSHVSKEVDRLFQKGRKTLSAEDIRKIREKYSNDEVIEQIQDQFIERQQHVQKVAKKFTKQISEKYGNMNYPLHIMLRKAMKYKQHYDLSNEEFEEFRRLYQNSLFGSERSSEIGFNAPRTRLSKVLNTTAYPYQMSEGMELNDKEYKILQEIIKSCDATRSIHQQIVIQSMTYEDLADEALTGTYHDRYNASCHVHPVVAAFFLPKFEELDQHMLRSNIANIFKSRFNRKPITGQADYNLLFNLVTDPNDVVCNEKNAMEDIHLRSNIQQSLWQSVYALRSGKYYDCNFTDFVKSINSCNINTIDSPDVLCGEEGNILKKLFATFSFRPTVVASHTLHPMKVSNVPYNVNNNSPPTIHSIPMITMRLPYQNANPNDTVTLQSSIYEPQYQLENGVLVPKVTDIIYSQGLIVFYVNRRFQNINYTNVLGPRSFNQLPEILSSLQKINTRPVQVKPDMVIHNETYVLRSVVLAETKKLGDNHLITGCSALIVKRSSKGVASNKYYYYNPKHASKYVEEDPKYQEEGKSPFTRNKPITTVDYYNADPRYIHSFQNLAETRGTIFVYENITKKKTLDSVLNINF